MWKEIAGLPLGSVVIFDPADGPGRSPDATYAQNLSIVARRGIQIFGYLTMDYGRRSPQEMIEEVECHRDWYRPTGIFLDEAPPSLSTNTAIMEVISHIRSQHLALATNPGQPDIDPEHAHLADYVVNFEGPLSAYRHIPFPSWTEQMDDAKFWHLVYEVGDSSTMRWVMATAVRRHAGVVYVTDATMPNPWERLPAYWEAERLQVTGPLRRHRIWARAR
jgi:hypothetical protein